MNITTIKKAIVLGLFLVLLIGITGALFPKKAKMDPDSEEFFKYARYFFTKEERKIFLNLPSNELRHKFIKYFWEIRDPNPFTEENEFQYEILKRVNYVNQYLKEGPIPGWKTDRGRIYLLLGPPWQKAQEYYNKGSVIYWRYEETDIVTRFIDANGQGIYRMDLTFTSLKLLDVLERRKHYISTKEDSKFSVGLLKYNVTYDNEKEELLFKVKTDNVNFDTSKDDPKKMIAKFKIDIMVYGGKEIFSKLSEIKTVEALEDELLKDKATVELRVPLKLSPGKLKIDTIVTDFLGDATKRTLIKVNKK